jgi:hypothetical protein
VITLLANLLLYGITTHHVVKKLSKLDGKFREFEITRISAGDVFLTKVSTCCLRHQVFITQVVSLDLIGDSRPMHRHSLSTKDHRSSTMILTTLAFALAQLCSVGAFAPQSHHSFSAALRSNYPLSPSSLAVVTKPTLERSVATLEKPSAPAEETLGASDTSSEEYKQGFAIIAFITLLNASLAPVWHTVFAEGGPPPLFLNAVVSVVAFVGLLVGGPLLDRNVDTMSTLADTNEEKWGFKSFRGGMELGVWKGLGKYWRTVVSRRAL